MQLNNLKYNLADIIKIPWQFDKPASGVIAAQRLLSGMERTLKLLAVAKFIDTSINIVSKELPLSAIYPTISLLVLLIGYSWLSGVAADFAKVKLRNSGKARFRTAIVEKTSKLEYKHIENHDTWDLISRLSKDPELRLEEGYTSIFDSIGLIIQIAGILAVLFTQVWWAGILILVLTVPLFHLALKGGKATYEADREVSKYNRRYAYLTEVLTGRESMEERTLFGYTPQLNDRWVASYETARKLLLKTIAKWFVRSKLGGLLTTAASIIIVIILINPTISGAISIGMFISLVNSVFSLINSIAWDLSHLTNMMAKNNEFMKDLTAFANLTEDKGALLFPKEAAHAPESIEFKNVRFKYPRTDRYILNGLSLTMERGKHYAFVGANGAGKTTITKLLTGLYEDFEGDILINGKNIREYGKDELKGLFSVVYQDFAKYSVSIKDNIALGNVKTMGTSNAENEILAAAAVMDITSTIEKLPDKLDTPLGKIMDGGMDVSGGEWQRIAMSRSYVSPAAVRILDEPTSALDPLSESKVYEKFEQISKNTTTIFISHRLGSTKLADEIFVIDSGIVTEQGGHAELMDKNGIYAEMYDSQRSWYQ